MDRARTALAVVATPLGAGEPEPVAEYLEQRLPRIQHEPNVPVVDGARDRNLASDRHVFLSAEQDSSARDPGKIE
nr:hypothetical protein Ade03nite_24960 [Actinoplanes derwentensis]